MVRASAELLTETLGELGRHTIVKSLAYQRFDADYAGVLLVAGHEPPSPETPSALADRRDWQRRSFSKALFVQEGNRHICY
jgi:hypothetical protein